MIKLKDVIEDLELGKVYTDKDRPPFQVESVNEAQFSKDQIEIMRKAYGTLKTMNPTSPTYKKFIKFLEKLPKNQLKQLAAANIKFVSMLAKNRIKGESVLKKNPGEFVDAKFSKAIDNLPVSKLTKDLVIKLAKKYKVDQDDALRFVSYGYLRDFGLKESVNEAPGSVPRDILKQLDSELNKASDIIIKITDKYKKEGDIEGMVKAWMRGLHLRLRKGGIKI